MGGMKRFAIRLAVCVYRYHMSDEEIIRSVKNNPRVDEKEAIDIWLLEQLNTVRNLPSIYAVIVDQDT